MVEGFSPEELEERADKVHPAKLLAAIQQQGFVAGGNCVSLYGRFTYG